MNREPERGSVTMLKEIYNDFINIFPSRLKSKVNVTYDLLNTGAVRDLAKTLFEKTVFYHEGLTGGNDSDNALIFTINGEEFLIPQRSSRSSLVEQIHQKVFNDV
ncbi:unnamed protein product [Leptidea sinapis]|uniref:Uncharacterized protein n=1 Tax=Leptidea sinapis TaxID=189913 RepID=A0A5E4R4N6_9NEOP|nr:unnamed protein product [Leptidea sinapis]